MYASSKDFCYDAYSTDKVTKTRVIRRKKTGCMVLEAHIHVSLGFAGVKELFIVCCSHSSQIEDYITQLIDKKAFRCSIQVIEGKY
jgi:hypothetical protein